MPRGRDGGRLDVGGPSLARIVRAGPQLGEQRRGTVEGGREGDAVPGPRDRQEVALDGAADGLVPEGDRAVVLDHEPMLHGLGQAGPDVRVQDPIAVSRSTRGPRRWPIRFGLERLGDIGELLSGQRQTGRRHEAKDAPALGRADRQARDDEVVQRPVERGARELATDRQQFLGQQRQAARSFDDEEQQAGRRPFALDALDQRREVVPVQWRQGEPFERAGSRRDRRQVVRPRVVARHDVRLVRGDDRESLVARDRDRKRTSARVAASARCRSSSTRATGRRSPSRPSMPRMASSVRAWRRSAALAIRSCRSPEARPEVRQESNDIGERRTEHVREFGVGQRAQRGADRPHHRSVRVVGAAWPGGATQDRPSPPLSRPASGRCPS